MKRTLLIFVSLILLTNLVTAQSVSLQYDTSSVHAKYAVKMLQQALIKKGYSVQRKEADHSIFITINSQSLNAEEYTLLLEGKKITITGGDGRGIIYGSLSLAEDLRNGISLQDVLEKSEISNLPFRAIKFDLPLGYLPA